MEIYNSSLGGCDILPCDSGNRFGYRIAARSRRADMLPFGELHDSAW